MKKSVIIWKWTGILILWALCLWVAFHWGGKTRKQEVLPHDIPSAFALDERDLPKGYSLLRGIPLLQKLGMERNPDYVNNLSEVAALGQRGAVCSFAAIYGRDDVPALMLNGIYFRNATHCERFIEEEKSKDLLLAAFRKKDETGIWVFFIACDSKLVYSTGEHHQIANALEKYAQRYRLEKLFNHMPNTPDE